MITTSQRLATIDQIQQAELLTLAGASLTLILDRAATMADTMLESIWKTAFPDRSRPSAYVSDEPDDDGFLPITDAGDLLVDNLQTLKPEQLYALTANNSNALVEVQKEFTRLERLAQHIKTRDPLPNPYKDPQQLPSREIFEERKEANLYNYKYDSARRMLPARYTTSEHVIDQEKFDCREPPEPFAQGGFIPNDKQYKSLMIAARNEGREHNPDNQSSYAQNFALEDRPKGTWIARMLPPEAAPMPKTRARAALLSGTADRQTRFNGEKIPLTRQLSSNTFDAPSPGKRTATPVDAQSPAPKRRRIDVTDITDAMPKRKHPNQYTKRAEEAARLAAEQVALANSHPIVVNLEGTSLTSTSSPAPVKKKHPNQHTKRKEKEEAERREREELEGRARSDPEGQAGENHGRMDPWYYHRVASDGSISSPTSSSPNPLGMPQQSVHQSLQHYTPPSEPQIQKPKHPNQYTKASEREAWQAAFQAGRQNKSASPAVDKPKHPNQYTKRKEELARRAIDQDASTTGTQTPPTMPIAQSYAYPYPYAHPPHPQQAWQPHPYLPVQAPEATWAKPATVSVTQNSTRGRDPTTMSKQELRTHLFKDHELIGFLQRDHSWLNDDPDQANAWKEKILASQYPVRTWAMLRKWKEWKVEGKDKRPRDKDGNRIRTATVPASTPRNMDPVVSSDSFVRAEIRSTNPTRAEDFLMPDTGDDAGAKSSALNTATEGGTTSTHALPASNVHINARPQSPLRWPSRPLRTRLDTVHIGSPGPQPRSPLVNGINARDLDTWVTSPAIPIDSTPRIPKNQAQTDSKSFNTSLRALDEVDSNTKVDSWRDNAEPQTDYAASTSAGKGVLREYPRRSLRSQSQAQSAAVVQGTEDEIYPSSIDANSNAPDDQQQPNHHHEGEVDKFESDSEDPLHHDGSPLKQCNTRVVSGASSKEGDEDDSNAESASSATLTDSNDRDDTYGPRTRTRPHRMQTKRSAARPATRTTTRASATPTKTNSRTRSTTQPAPVPASARPSLLRTRSTRSSQQQQQQQQQRIDPVLSETQLKDTAVGAVVSAITRRSQAQSQPSSQHTTFPGATTPSRRRGLRPNPPKRRITNDEEDEESDDSPPIDDDSGSDMIEAKPAMPTPTRRSTRNSAINGAGTNSS